MATKTLEYKIHEQQVRGPSEEWEIAAGDWRDPDIILRLDGLRVYSRDEKFRSHQGAVEPDWKQGTYLMNDTGQVVCELGPDPAPIFKQCLLEGRVLYGAIIARDLQRHN